MVLTFWNVLLCIVGSVVLSDVILVSLVQPWKALVPRLVTPLPMVTLARPLQ